MNDPLEKLFNEALDRTEAPTSELGSDEVVSALKKIGHRAAPEFVLFWVVYSYGDRVLTYVQEEDPGPVPTYLAKRQVSVPVRVKQENRVWAYVQGVVRGH